MFFMSGAAWSPRPLQTEDCEPPLHGPKISTADAFGAREKEAIPTITRALNIIFFTRFIYSPPNTNCVIINAISTITKPTQAAIIAFLARETLAAFPSDVT